nr:hypothetical protein [Tanacetum cinerariifolium]
MPPATTNHHRGGGYVMAVVGGLVMTTVLVGGGNDNQRCWNDELDNKSKRVRIEKYQSNFTPYHYGKIILIPCNDESPTTHTQPFLEPSSTAHSRPHSPQSPSSGSSSSSDASSSDSHPPRFHDLKDVYDSCIVTQRNILEHQKEYSITLLEQRFLVFVTWSSKKQETFAFSSSKAEYAAVTSIARQVLWLRTLLVDFNC